MYTIIENNTEIVEFGISSGDSFGSGSGDSNEVFDEPLDSTADFEQLTTEIPDIPVLSEMFNEFTTKQIIGIVVGVLAGLVVIAVIRILCIRNTKHKYDVTKTQNKESNSKP